MKKVKLFEQYIKESTVTEIKRSLISGTSGRTIDSLEARKYELKKDVTGAIIGDFTNVTLPKGTIIHNLPGGVFANHFSLKQKYTTKYSSQAPQWNDTFGVMVRQMPETLKAIEDNSKVLESVVTEKVQKIACLECDEVNTKKAWEKNNGFCPSCKDSSRGVAEAKLSTVHKAAKKGSYPAVVVVVQDGKVIHQEPVSTPQVAPATFNVMQERYPKATIHLEDKTGQRLFTESFSNITNITFTAEQLHSLHQILVLKFDQNSRIGDIFGHTLNVILDDYKTKAKTKPNKKISVRVDNKLANAINELLDKNDYHLSLKDEEYIRKKLSN